MMRLKSIILYLTVILFFLGSIFYGGLPIEAESPTSLKVKIKKVELFKDKDSLPITVFENQGGVEKDIIKETDALFGQGSISPGEYKRVKFTVDPIITYSGPNPCGGNDIVDQPLDIGSSELYFATADDGGGQGWSANGSQGYPFLLMNPIVVEGNVTTNVKIVFNTANTLQCVSNNPTLYPPTMNIVQWKEASPLSACQFPSDYWFMHYNLFVHFGEINHDPPYGVSEFFPYGSVIAGWGTLSMNAPDATGKGTMTVDPSKTYANGGMAEHRHEFEEYDPSDTEQGYHDPVGGTTMTLNYQISGRKMIIYLPEGGTIEGAFTNDCSTYIGTMISSGSEGGDNDIVYAVKKDYNSGSTLPQGKYLGTMMRFALSYNETQGPPYPLQHMRFVGDMVVLDVVNDIKFFNWSTHMELMPSYIMNNPPPYDRFIIPTDPDLILPVIEEAEIGTIPYNEISINSYGLLTAPNDPEFDSFIAFNNSFTGVYSGITMESIQESNGYNHYIQGGSFMKLDDDPQLSEMAGKWYVVMLENDAYDDGDDNQWLTGDEYLSFGITYGEATIDANGNVLSISFTHRNIFDNSTKIEIGSGGKIEKRIECYYPDTSLTDPTCTDGIQIPVFFLTNPEGQEIGKMVVNTTKNVAIIWGSPIDVDENNSGSVKDKPQNSDWQTNTFYYASQRQMRGMAVKIE